MAEGNPQPSAREPKKYRTVTFTDLEKKADGHPTGRYSKTFTLANYPPGELDALIGRMRGEQAEKNAIYKRAQFLKKKEGGAPIEQLAATKMTHRVQAKAVSEPGRAKTAGRAACPSCGAATVESCDAAVKAPSVGSPCVPQGLHGRSSSDIHAPEALSEIHLRLDAGTGNSTALLGSSKQGKSTCMMQLFRQHYAAQDCVSTLFASNPQIALYEGKRLIVSQAYVPKLIKLAASINRKTGNHYEFCFLLDDIVDKRDDVVLRELILTLRNSNLSSIVCLQYGNLLAKVARANVNNLLLFGFNSDEAIELICQQYLATHLRSQGIQKQDWGRYYREATRDHGFIYVHPSSNEVSYHRLAKH